MTEDKPCAREMKKFPRNKTWDKFAAEMPYVDAWYNILDSPEEGEIFDYMFEIMTWAKEVGVWGEDDPAINSVFRILHSLSKQKKIGEKIQRVEGTSQ